MTILKEKVTCTEKVTVTTRSICLTPECQPLGISNRDKSFFGKLLAIYTRNAETSELYSIEVKNDCDLEKKWQMFIVYCQRATNWSISFNEKVKEVIVPTEVADVFTNDMGVSLKVSEYQLRNELQVRGCVTIICNENNFNDWFTYHSLVKSKIHNDCSPLENKHSDYQAEQFTNFFAEHIKNTVHDDQWMRGGREKFLKRVKYFTERNVRIEAVLPAFPCKSSNINKVNGIIPDKGEEFALRRLAEIVFEVKKMHEPGMKIWIISDGHVFSDCIGVDDDVVTHYTNELKKLCFNICKELKKKHNDTSDDELIEFCGLNEIFYSPETSELFDKRWVENVFIEHCTGSKIDEKSDLSRQILMKGCDTDDGALRENICTPGHPRLQLYRGFSKFMSEDLALLPFFRDVSRKKFKKLISKIAFNMIRRNDAYSNLVEIMFPHHLRFSIHAHNNGGPKYGIKVISTNQCKTVKSLEDSHEPTFEDLLHIPTPWHNCIVEYKNPPLYLYDKKTKVRKFIYTHFDKQENSKFDNDDNNHKPSIFFLTKSKVVREAIAKGFYEGKWIDTSIADGQGGYYVIHKNIQTQSSL